MSSQVDRMLAEMEHRAWEKAKAQAKERPDVSFDILLLEAANEVTRGHGVEIAIARHHGGYLLDITLPEVDDRGAP